MALGRKLVRRIQFAGGEYVAGEWTNGTPVRADISASVQPARGGDLELVPEGRRHEKSYRLYTTSTFTDTPGSQPDRVLLFGEEYEVVHSQRWDSGLIPHVKAIAVKLDKAPDDALLA